jgi:hypothetical protein
MTRSMSPFTLSVLAWLGGGVAGAMLSKEHRVAGFALGALVVGAVSDVGPCLQIGSFSFNTDFPYGEGRLQNALAVR